MPGANGRQQVTARARAQLTRGRRYERHLVERSKQVSIYVAIKTFFFSHERRKRWSRGGSNTAEPLAQTGNSATQNADEPWKVIDCTPKIGTHAGST